ncbi:MAG TPA: hypothetical protein VFL69_06115 [Marmoricola sp.]|nr:hypothetical protein [Marmoricola sp.]
MLTPLRRRVASAALLLLVPLVGACGFGYQTDQVYQPATGTDNRTGQVYILNAMVVTVDGGKGTFAGTLVNESPTRPDKMIAVTGPNLQGSQSQVPLPPNSSVNLAQSGQVWVSGPQVKPGGFVTMTFTFADGQSTQMAVPVISRTGYYSDVALPGSRSAKSPSPSSSPTQSSSQSSSQG